MIEKYWILYLCAFSDVRKDIFSFFPTVYQCPSHFTADAVLAARHCWEQWPASVLLFPSVFLHFLRMALQAQADQSANVAETISRICFCKFSELPEVSILLLAAQAAGRSSCPVALPWPWSHEQAASCGLQCSLPEFSWDLQLPHASFVI